MELTYKVPSPARVSFTWFGPNLTSLKAQVSRFESFSFFGQVFQERSWFPPCADTIVNVLQSDGVGVPHRASPIGGEAVAGDVDYVDVGGTKGVVFFED